MAFKFATVFLALVLLALIATNGYLANALPEASLATEGAPGAARKLSRSGGGYYAGGGRHADWKCYWEGQYYEAYYYWDGYWCCKSDKARGGGDWFEKRCW